VAALTPTLSPKGRGAKERSLFASPQPSRVEGEGKRNGFGLATASPKKLLPPSLPLEGGRARVGVNKLPPAKAGGIIKAFAERHK